MEFYYPNRSLPPGFKNFTLATNLPADHFSLSGGWTITLDHAVASQNAILEYNFTANKVYLVMNPSSNNPGGDKVRVFLDGKVVNSQNAGADVTNGELTVNSDRLYNLIDLKGHPGNHLLKLQFENNATQAFAFTFG